MRVLVTGGAGFVGANLIRRLLREDLEVHTLIHPTADWRIADIHEQVTVHLDEDLASPRHIVEDVRPDWIFHLAAHGAYSWQTDVDRMIDVNLRFGMHLMEQAVACGVESFVVAGSSSEYGFKDHAPDEEEFAEPNSAYAVTKLAFTSYCRQVAASVGTRIKVLRLYSVFGPWEDPRRLIPRLIVEGFHGRLPPLASANTARD